MPGVLTTLQTETVKIIKSDRYFAAIEPLHEQLGDLTNQIVIALKKIGLCVLVVTPGAKVQHTNAPGPILDPVTLVVQVSENVLLNQGATGTKMRAPDVAEYVAWLLHYPNHAHHRQDIYPLTCQEIKLAADKPFVLYNVTFVTRTALAGIVTT